MTLSLTVRGGERARSFESWLMSLRIWDGGCVKTSRFGSFRNWVRVAPVASSLAVPDLCSARGIFYLSLRGKVATFLWSPVSQQMLVWSLLSLEVEGTKDFQVFR